MSSESRRIRRLLLRRGQRKNLENVYADNKGNEYKYKFIARMASFYNVIMGCFKNGFPIAVPHLHYLAWAFYPFFFVSRNLRVKAPIVILNHERIHIRQQRDIHLTFSVALTVLFIYLKQYDKIILLLFLPTVFYFIDCLRVAIKYRLTKFSDIRGRTSFEAEAISRASNTDYLYERKFWAVLAYTGIKLFMNYGQTKSKQR